MKKIILILLTVIIGAYLILFLEGNNKLVVDDVHPNYECSSLLEKADMLYVIPNFEEKDIGNGEFTEWCGMIRELNKTTGLHGITHTYHEFAFDVREEILDRAITSFETCFGEKPELFRPPYNKISEQNQMLVESKGMELYKEKYVMHPYCHCAPKSFRMKVLNWAMGCF